MIQHQHDGEKKMIRKAVGLVRVSTAKQAKDGVSMEAQIERIKAYCEYRQLELVDIYEDKGISGAKGENERDGLKQALAVAKEQKAIFIVYSLSRLSRKVLATLTMIEDLKSAGADFVSLTENIETSTPAGMMLCQMIASFNEYEREMAKERTQTVMTYKREHKELTGNRPIGYTGTKGIRNLCENDKEQQAIQLAKEYKDQGLSLRAIATKLAENGYYSRTGNKYTAKTVATMVA
jgi:site-specific DNA recombinase